MEAVKELAAKFALILPHLDERRLLLGVEARMLGHGGIRTVAEAAGVSEATVSHGMAEAVSGTQLSGRVRRAGGGRKRLTVTDPGLRGALLALVEPHERGDPTSPLRWTTLSTRTLAAELTREGHPVSADTVAAMLRSEGFSLQANVKTLEGAQHPDRDAQFRYLNEQARAHRDAGYPVISVDTKKKELVGEFRNAGRTWRPKRHPVPVNVYDFPESGVGKAIPYGIYDVAADVGWVNVGCDHDTAAFAVESIRRWWNDLGHATYPAARRLLITADAGGSNGYRTRAWKTELAALAAASGLTITVCHFPPGTSKWNKIEHRLFAAITGNWRGRPLTSHQVVVNTGRTDSHDAEQPTLRQRTTDMRQITVETADLPYWTHSENLGATSSQCHESRNGARRSLAIQSGVALSGWHKKTSPERARCSALRGRSAGAPNARIASPIATCSLIEIAQSVVGCLAARSSPQQ
nr:MULTISPECIES: ISAzo13 family transposase [unclassified Nocardia]